MSDDPVLECQTCGEVIRVLSLAEAQIVSWNPEKFIMDCRTCFEWLLRKQSRF